MASHLFRSIKPIGFMASSYLFRTIKPFMASHVFRTRKPGFDFSITQAIHHRRWKSGNSMNEDAMKGDSVKGDEKNIHTLQEDEQTCKVKSLDMDAQGRLKIRAENGKLVPGAASSLITKVIKENYWEGLMWYGMVQENIKEHQKWLSAFKDKVVFLPEQEKEIQEIFDRRCRHLLATMLYRIRKDKKRPDWMTQDQYDAALSHWATDEFKKASMRGQELRALNKPKPLHTTEITIGKPKDQSEDKFIRPAGNNLNPAKVSSRAVSNVIKKNYYQGLFWFKTIRENPKLHKVWFDSFKEQVTWAAKDEKVVKKLFDRKCSNQLIDLLSRAHRNGKKPKWMTDSQWLCLEEHKRTEEFQKVSRQAIKNKPSGPTHTGGATPFLEHVIQDLENQEPGKQICLEKVKKDLHMKGRSSVKKPGKQICLEKVKKDLHMKGRSSVKNDSKNMHNKNEKSTTSDMDASTKTKNFIQSAGGKNRGRISGLGSLSGCIGEDGKTYYVIKDLRISKSTRKLTRSEIVDFVKGEQRLLQEIEDDQLIKQAHIRDLSGFVETRQQLLTLNSNLHMNWIGLAVAHHLNSNASKAIEVLEEYEEALEDGSFPENERCEHGEILLYKISLLEECGFFERALEELQKKEPEIVDKLSYKEQEVSLLVKLGRLEEGEKLYRALLAMNPENYSYYEGLQKCVGLYSEDGHFSPDERDRLDALYKVLGKQFKCSSAVKRIPLGFLQGDRFREAADIYMRPLLTEGVPSLFSDLSSLYDHPGKADILEQLILELENSIRTTGKYPGRVEKEPPSTLMWVLFLLAQHYDKRGKFELSLSKIDEAIEHTPTVHLYSVKSRILKHAGDLAAAAAFADEARCMDLSDRYVNSECAKRMLQADQVVLPETIAVLFTEDGDQHNNLHDMQSKRYELACAESYFRQGDIGLALKKFLAVEKQYTDITKDLFDYYSYFLRKITLCGYVEMLKFQDSHLYFHKASAGAIRCYIKLHDSPPKSIAEETNMSKLLPSQKKKMRQKQRKAEARAKKEAHEKNEESSVSGISKSGKRQAKPVDPDPHGDKLLQVEDPLLEATIHLKLLQKNSPDSLETHFLSFELYMRKQEILLALQAVKQLLRLDAEHPDSEKHVWRVLEAERQTISQLHGKSLFETNNSFLMKHEDSLMHRATFGEMYVLDPSKRCEAVRVIEGSTIIESSDEEMDDADSDSDESDSDDTDEGTPVKKADQGKKRADDSALKTQVSSRKAKNITPEKTDGKKTGHTATPHPRKKGGKTPPNSEAKTPKSGGQFSCTPCSKSFNSESGFQQHKKAKHGGQ